jgi:hypothetical protein
LVSSDLARRFSSTASSWSGFTVDLVENIKG